MKIISAAMMYLLRVPFIVDVRERKDAGPCGPSYFRGPSIFSELVAA